MQVDEFARARDEALAQVSEVQERNLRVIQGLMDDLAKADVVRARGEEGAREEQGRRNGGAREELGGKGREWSVRTCAYSSVVCVPTQ